MSQQHSFVIEFEEEAIAVVVREDDQMMFHAVHPLTYGLNGQVFADAVEARRAAVIAMRQAA